MEKDLDYTVKFECVSEEKMSVGDTIDFVYKALIEKGYDPINQLIGYVLSGDSSYITSHKNARIKIFERDDILEEVISYYVRRK